MPMIIASAVISTGRKRVKPACERGVHGVIAGVHALAREADHQHAVGGGDAHAHDGAGERRHADVVWVRNSIQTMPASAAGSAVMMMNGSSQDWKFTTISR